ncbi:MAG: DUF2283 domain-containing protein [Chloroflexi bacterium]|nr:DUF2283 domain-containing protein [Chloroflexota bacterium]
MAQDTFLFDSERFKEANRDYIDRIETEGLTAIYDATLDTLFVEIGGPKEALTEHIVDNIMVRIAPDSLQVVGFEILDFLDDFLPANRLVREAFHDWKLSRDADSQRTLLGPQYAPIKDAVEAAIEHLRLRAASAS